MRVCVGGGEVGQGRGGGKRSQALTLEVEEGVVHQLRLGPVLEPDEVDVLGEGRVLATHLLEVVSVLLMMRHTRQLLRTVLPHTQTKTVRRMRMVRTTMMMMRYTQPLSCTVLTHTT